MRTRLLSAIVLLCAVPSTAAALAPGDHYVVSGQPGLNAFLPGGNNFSNLDFFGGGSAADGQNAVSGDGRYVVFLSRSDSVDPRTDDDRLGGIYLRDTVANTTELVSIAADGTAAQDDVSGPTVSDDGRFVAFVSDVRLTADDTNGFRDIFLRDRQLGTTTLVSRNGAAADGFSRAPDISADGSRIAYESGAENLDGVDGGGPDTDSADDIYWWDRATGTTKLVSTNIAETAAANGSAADPAINATGTAVAFSSTGTNLHAADADNTSDVFVRVGVQQGDLGVVSLVSRATGAAGDKGTAASRYPAIDGDVVAFLSAASNLDSFASGGFDDDALNDVYLRNYVTNQTSLGSTAQNGLKLTVASDQPAIGHTPTSTTDKRVVFTVTLNGQRQLLLRDVAAATTTTVSRADGAAGAIVAPVSQPGISANGSSVLFTSFDPAASTEDDRFQGVYLRRGTSTLFVSRPSGVAPLLPGDRPASISSSDASTLMGAAGDVVLFTSGSDAIAGPSGGLGQWYARNLRTGEIELVSRGDGPAGAPADISVGDASISADGRLVAFSAIGTGFPGGSNNRRQIYVRDLVADTTVLAVPDTGGGLLDNAADEPALSADGRTLAFVSDTPDLGLATGGSDQIFVRDRTTGAMQIASTGPAGIGDQSAEQPTLTADGRRVAFVTDAANLGAEGAPGDPDVFVRDLSAGTTTLASVGTDGTALDRPSEDARISQDGSRVVFLTDASDAHPLDTNGTDDVFVRDLAAGTTDLVSRATGDVPPPGDGGAEGFPTPDGRHVAFVTDGALDPADADGASDIYLRDLQTGGTTLLTGGVAFDSDDAEYPQISAADGCLAFESEAPTAPGVPGSGSADFNHVFVRSLGARCVGDPAGPGGPGTPGGTTPGGTTPGGTPPGPTTPAADRTRPVVRSLGLTNRRFRVGTKATAISAATRRAPQGTTFRFTLSEAARVTITFQRMLPGRRVGKACRKPTAKLRKRKACTRYVSSGSLRRALKSGARRVAFSGRVGRKALPRGRYRATVTARDAAGNVSTARRVTFTVVR